MITGVIDHTPVVDDPLPTPTGALDTGARFGPLEWALSALIALIWGSSFWLIAVAIDDVEPAVVPLARVAFGALALLAVPAARVRLPRREYPRLVALGLIWMAIPFLLFPLAEQTTSSAVAGMINGSLPVVTVAVTAVLTRRRPTAFRLVAVVVGFVGIALISVGALGEGGGADRRGIVYLLGAMLCYALAVNIATPLQRRYGSLPVMLHVLIAAVLWTLPAGLEAFDPAALTWSSVLALIVLGAVGTGAAFSIYGALLTRTGPVRGMIGTFFTPIVALGLGIALRGEPITALTILGLGIVIVGAVMTSRPEAVTVAIRRR